MGRRLNSRKKKKEPKRKKEPGTISRHHKLPKSLGGSDRDENISYVTWTKHCAYHALFANGTPYDVASILNAVWISSDYELIVRRKNESNDSRM